MNLVFVLLLVAAAIAGAVRGDIKAVGQGAFDGASQGVTLAIGLIGVMALWLGLMRIAEKAGLVEKLARAARPIFRPLFPPSDHYAAGSTPPEWGVSSHASSGGIGGRRRRRMSHQTPTPMRARPGIVSVGDEPGLRRRCGLAALNSPRTAGP